jgi:hypothetical protein
VNNGDPGSVTNLQGQTLRWEPLYPLILIGSFNKPLGYLLDPFREIHYRFWESLSTSTHLVICGYSFGDKEVNRVVLEWLLSNLDRQLVIVHPNRDELIEGARQGIRRQLHHYQSARIRFVLSRLEDLPRASLTEEVIRHIN